MAFGNLCGLTEPSLPISTATCSPTRVSLLQPQQEEFPTPSARLPLPQGLAESLPEPTGRMRDFISVGRKLTVLVSIGRSHDTLTSAFLFLLILFY